MNTYQCAHNALHENRSEGERIGGIMTTEQEVLNLAFVRQVTELAVATTIYDNVDFGITHEQLAQLLGVEAKPENYVEYFNALLHIQTNPLLDALEIDKRLWLVAVCERALTDLLSRGN